MADHCPFLNRKDARCASAFTLNGLSHTFAHCFSDYATCPTYAQLLGERRRLRAEAGSRFVTLTIARRQPPTARPMRMPAAA